MPEPDWDLDKIRRDLDRQRERDEALDNSLFISAWLFLILAGAWVLGWGVIAGFVWLYVLRPLLRVFGAHQYILSDEFGVGWVFGVGMGSGAGFLLAKRRDILRLIRRR